MPSFFDYTLSNLYTAGQQPNTIHVSDTGLSYMFRKQLFEKAISVFDFNMPDNWDKDYFRYSLFMFGNVTIFDSGVFGVIPQYGALSGYNVFYMPDEALVANPLLPSINRLKIGRDCEVIKLRPDYSGIMDIVGYYADQMALITETFTCDIQNSKLSYIFMATNEAQAQAYKKMYDSIYKGEPNVVIDKKLLGPDGEPQWQSFNQALKNTYIGDLLIDALNAVEDRFCTLIGIDNANTDKRERLISSEVEANKAETKALSSLWLDTMQKGIRKANEMFSLDLSVKLSQVGKGITADGKGVNIGDVQGKPASV